METVMVFVPLMGLWIAVLGCYVVICLVLFVYRLKRWPPLDPLSALVGAGVLLWLAPQQPNAVWAGIFLFFAGWGAFIAGIFASTELHNAKPE